MKLRHLLRLYGQYMWYASENCDMNHMVDHGEWSSGFDGEVYDFWMEKFRHDIYRVGITMMEFGIMLDDAMKKEKRPWIQSEYHSIINSLG